VEAIAIGPQSSVGRNRRTRLSAIRPILPLDPRALVSGLAFAGSFPTAIWPRITGLAHRRIAAAQRSSPTFSPIIARSAFAIAAAAILLG
jgi:hypothetical protein